MKFKILCILSVIVFKFTFADANTVGPSVKIITPPLRANHISKNLKVTYHLYSYKLSLKQLNDILVVNRIRPISIKDEKIFYRDKLQNNDIPKIDVAFSKITNNRNNGISICEVDGTICQFDEGIITPDGKMLRLIPSFYPYIKNHQISIRINTSNKINSKYNQLKNSLVLENILGKNYVIGSCKPSKKLCNWQIMLVSFSLMP